MPRKEFAYLLDGFSRLVVYFSTERGIVVRFVVKIEYNWDGVWRELIRYDCFHGFVHKDLFARSGTKKRVVKYRYLDPGTGLNAAITDCVENYQSYVERWRDG